MPTGYGDWTRVRSEVDVLREDVRSHSAPERLAGRHSDIRRNRDMRQQVPDETARQSHLELAMRSLTTSRSVDCLAESRNLDRATSVDYKVGRYAE